MCFNKCNAYWDIVRGRNQWIGKKYFRGFANGTRKIFPTFFSSSNKASTSHILLLSSCSPISIYVYRYTTLISILKAVCNFFSKYVLSTLFLPGVCASSYLIWQSDLCMSTKSVNCVPVCWASLAIYGWEVCYDEWNANHSLLLSI